jgi:hypothetical protein
MLFPYTTYTIAFQLIDIMKNLYLFGNQTHIFSNNPNALKLGLICF